MQRRIVTAGTDLLPLYLTYLLESGLGPLGTSCLLSPSPAEFHRPRARNRLDLTAAGCGRARRPPAPHDDDDDDATGNLSVFSPRRAAGTKRRTAQRRAQRSSNSAALGLLVHRDPAMQEPEQQEESLVFRVPHKPRQTPMSEHQAM